jgi:hypothetical protein
MAVQQQSPLVQVLQRGVGSVFMQCRGVQWHSAHLIDTVGARETMGIFGIKTWFLSSLSDNNRK